MANRSTLVAEPWELSLLERWRSDDSEMANVSTGEAIRLTLVDAIIEGELAPGLRLGEERLASLFGVSRTPVREALVGLVNSNLAARDERGLLRVGSLSSEQILEVYAVRQVLEGFAAATAARVAGPAAIVRLKQLNAAFARSGERDDFNSMAADNLRFHAALAEATGNHLLSEFVEEMNNRLSRIRPTTLSYPNRASEAVAEHAAIIEAIEEHDGERAETLARAHMQAAERIRIAMLIEDS